MNRRKVSRRKKCGIKITSTPLNTKKGKLPLLSLKSISCVKKLRNGRRYSVFETPSLIDMGIDGKRNRSTNKQPRILMESEKFRSKQRYDTPLKPNKKSFLSSDLIICSKKLKFSHISGLIHVSKLSDCKKNYELTAGETNMIVEEGYTSKQKTLRRTIEKLKRNKVASSQVNQQVANEELRNKSDDGNALNSVYTISPECPGKNLSNSSSILGSSKGEETCRSEIINEICSSCKNLCIEDSSDLIETCRKDSFSSMTSETVIYKSFDADVPSDEYSENLKEKSGTIGTVGTECTKSDMIFHCDNINSNFMQDTENRALLENDGSRLQRENFPLSGVQIDENIDIPSKTYTSSNESCTNVSKCNDHISEKKSYDQELYIVSNSNRIAAVDFKKLNKVQTELDVSGDKNTTECSESNSRNPNAGKGKKVEKASGKGPKLDEIDSQNIAERFQSNSRNPKAVNEKKSAKVSSKKMKSNETGSINEAKRSHSSSTNLKEMEKKKSVEALGERRKLEEVGNHNASECSQSSSRNLKKVKGNKSATDSDTGSNRAQMPSYNEHNTNNADCLDSDEKSVFKKPMPFSISDEKESVFRKRTLKYDLRKDGKIPNLYNFNIYPSTSTPFDSPEVAVQNIPSLFKDMSPVNRQSKKDITGGCPLDDILLSIQSGKTYGKRTKIPVNMGKKRESQRWNSFVKKGSNYNYKKNSKFVNDSSILKNTSNCFLFESPPFNETVPVDDIWKPLNKSVKATEISSSQVNNGKTKIRKTKIQKIKIEKAKIKKTKPKKWFETKELQNMAKKFNKLTKYSLTTEKK